MSWAATSSKTARPGWRCTGRAPEPGRPHPPALCATYGQLFDPQAQPVVQALLARYAMLLANGVPVTGPGYLWRYAWRHAAVAGLAGLDLIRDLAASRAGAAARCRRGRPGGGRPACRPGVTGMEAVTPAEEATRLYRELAAGNPAFLPDLADALVNLGIRYSELGRRQEALAPAEEAVRLYRELAGRQSRLPARPRRRAEQPRQPLQRAGAPPGGAGPRRGSRPDLYRELAGRNPAFLPDLASALNNLGNRYSELGRRQEALAPAEEAVQLYRELAGGNPAFLPNLASALNNLGIRYSELGRRQEALAPTEEAVRIRRELAGRQPRRSSPTSLAR